tara:strand:- start:1346 stop:1735 length:390 start_codon:yes stop_codon:yes gene_type:complete
MHKSQKIKKNQYAIASVLTLLIVSIIGYPFGIQQTEASNTPRTFSKPIFEDIEAPYKNKYVIFFDFDLKREAQKIILMDFPSVKYIRDGCFPQVVLIAIEKDAFVLTEQLANLKEINWAIPEEPGIVCH